MAYASPSWVRGIPPRLEAWLSRGMRADTVAMAAALDALGRPDRACPSVLVGGTNGKGSTCAFIAAAAQAAGLKVGAFTSPPMGAFASHVAVGGIPLTEADLTPLADRLIAASPEPLTAFEAAAALAFLAFEARGVELAVVEVGMGGARDATNVIDPEVSVITQVDLDHTAILGETVEAIAREKAGIARAGRPLVTAARGPALAILREVCDGLGAELIQAPAAKGGWASFEAYVPGGPGDAGWQIGPSPLALVGDHQAENAAVALAALRLLARRLPIPREAAEAGLRGAAIPGRLTSLGGEPPVLFDGAHNPAGARALARALGSFPAPAHGVFGAFADKDVTGVLEAMAPRLATLWTVPAPGPRGADPEALAQAARLVAPGLAVRAAASISEGILGALGASPRGPVVVFGSLSLYDGAVSAASGR